MEYYIRFPQGKTRALTFSYDDGVRQDIRLVELFRRYGLRGTFNVDSGLFGKTAGRLTADEVRDLYIPAGQEDVWYATNIEIYDYVTAVRSLRFSLDGTTAQNPSAQDAYIRINHQTVCIPAGETVRL